METALTRAMQILARRTDTPRLDAQLLLCATLHKERSWLTAHREAAIGPEEADYFSSLCERRASGTPIAYLTGTAGFYGRQFAMNNSVLIPRPETEHLIEVTLSYLRARNLENTRLLDVGTGSGAIAVTMAAELPASTVDATDISAEAVRVARSNAGRHGVEARCRFYCGNLTDPVCGNLYDVVIANLPYVPTAALPAAPSPLSFEPVRALDGGCDGLELYRRLLSCVAEVLCPEALLTMEAAPPTIARLRELAQRSFPDGRVETGVDLAGLGRYVSVYQQVRH
ncbi:MAG: peptide chain release factor N(5)-glutamine methyltransferase [Candidatus Eremiobacteraeota bacterium]|nr:peptide chain release factor N(5)-glutamine methyltransferase [Candidatus Eremiobacteraeota bacterium]